ncbi:hypothetical protein J2802_005019 [Paraburkholderia caribensis]|nr:hypothetical protein [Paraburkholderia caribensis]MDR6384586.1 hypothetical protein [Paraburkholderia caribensis]
MKVGQPKPFELLRPDRKAGAARNESARLRQHREAVRGLLADLQPELVGKAKGVANRARSGHRTMRGNEQADMLLNLRFLEPVIDTQGM